MSVKLLTEHHLEFLSFKGGCTGWSESTLVKMPHCWKSHVTYFEPAHEMLVLIALSSVEGSALYNCRCLYTSTQSMDVDEKSDQTLDLALQHELLLVAFRHNQ